jgi:vancomycin resistance protein YoaR
LNKLKYFFLLIFFTLIVSGCGNSSENGTENNEEIEQEIIESKVKENVYLDNENVGGMGEMELWVKITEYALNNDIEPVDASINKKTWDIIYGKTGKKVNIEKTADAVLNANEGERLNYIVENVQPEITSKDIKNKVKVIGNYSTVLLNRSKSRINNIKLACSKLNYKILQPDEEFSFNDTVGKRSAGKGYKVAPIIVNTKDGPKYKPAYGGGVCQISSTMYNAVRDCNLKVTERHPHSKKVGYVPKGKDATVSYGTMDFKFVNNRDHPIMLRFYLGKRSLTVKIIENRDQ